MKANIDKMQIAAVNKKRQQLLKNITTIFNANRVTEESTPSEDIKDIIDYLYKISINASYCVFAKEMQDKNIQANELEKLIFDLDQIVKLQLSRNAHTSIILENREIRDNFAYWSTISTKVLLGVLKKEYYIAVLIDEYFEKDMRWNVAVVALLSKLAQSSLSFINIEHLMDKSMVHRDIGEIHQVIDKVIGLQLLAATQCAETWAIDKDVAWGARGIKFWLSAINLYKLIGEKAQVEVMKEKIEGMQKRIQDEDEDEAKHTNDKHNKSIKLLSIDELISGSDY